MSNAKSTFEWYKNAADYLGEFNPTLETVLYNLGEPVADKSIDTAAVILRHGSDDLEFHVNDSFISQFSPDRQAGVLTHEAIHMLKKHTMEKRDESKKNGWTNKKALTIAQEAITNDLLDDLGLKLPDIESDNGEKISYRQAFIFGPETIGTYTVGMTTDEVYRLVIDKGIADEDDQSDDSQDGNGNDSQNSEDSQDSQSGDSGDSEDSGKIKPQPMCDHSHNSDDEAYQAEKALHDKLDKDSRYKASDISEVTGEEEKGSSYSSQAAGDGFSERKAARLAKKYGTTVEWLKLIHSINPDFLHREGGYAPRLKEADWTRKNLRAGALSPTMKMPRYSGRRGAADRIQGNRKPQVVIAVDTSMSIPTEVANIMTKALETIPKSLIEAHVITFSTQYVEYDKDTGNIAQGGTDFSAVYQYLKDKKFKDKTTSVVVFTDGAAIFDNWNKPEGDVLADKWQWVMYNTDFGNNMYNIIRNNGYTSNQVNVLDLKDLMPDVFQAAFG